MKRLFFSLGCFIMALTGLSQPPQVQTGADQLDVILPNLAGKRVALMVNQTSLVGKTHLADTLKARGINIVKAFAPEHGFRGKANAGETVNDGVDARSGIAVVSLYGKNYKATPAHLQDVDVVVFDIQDVGARFYTFISSLHYLMEACAENNKPLLLLDRPNPNGSYIDGPILQPAFKSFVGMHPIPVVHGMSIGEYAQMINGEGWLAGGRQCSLQVIKVKGWKHSDTYQLPVAPSPNLPNNHSVQMYPSICFFEGTVFSLGRGTVNPFEMIGHPDLKLKFTFTPVSIDSMAKTPPLEGQLCHGIDLRHAKPEKKISLRYLIGMYKIFPDKEKFFNNYFEKLAGTTELREQIKKGMSEASIRATWKPGLDAFQVTRAKYLLYE
jgi:uncharacterized protein YbbC (DUF1343 family)